ncbi:hypothetical protein BVRB_9g213630 [Beta vulgaris subsp. vulgaris]|nr:hypothetical protein BVRB_9g213630 [Beta vulgaris subsp. vulgaris]
MNSPESERSPAIKLQKHLITTINGGITMNLPKEAMIDEIPVKYTSLREVIPANFRRRNSEEEIQIKNPLVKQAALAYLSPMSTPPPEYDNWFKKLLFRFNGGRFLRREKIDFDQTHEEEEKKDKVGCIDFINDVVFGNSDSGGVEKQSLITHD